MESEPGIDVRSVTESRRGPGILIWIPGYIDSDGTIIVADVLLPQEIEGETDSRADAPVLSG